MGKFLEDLGLEIHRFQGFSGVFGKIIGIPGLFFGYKSTTVLMFVLICWDYLTRRICLVWCLICRFF